MPSTLMQRMTALDAKVLRRSPGDIYVAPPAWTSSDGPVCAVAWTSAEFSAAVAIFIGLITLGALGFATVGEAARNWPTLIGEAGGLAYGTEIARRRRGKRITLRSLPAAVPLRARSKRLTIVTTLVAAALTAALIALRNPLLVCVLGAYALVVTRKSQQRLLRIQHSEGGIIVKLAIRGRRKRGTSELYLLRKPTTHIEDLGPLTKGNA